jgi:hypothetical protein
MASNKKWMSRIALTGLATFLSLAAVECGLRVRGHLLNKGILENALTTPITPPVEGPAELGHMIRLSRNRRIIYDLKPNLDVTFKGHRVTTNKSGFRGPNYPQEKTENTIRIVGLGDSVMFGHGVSDGDVYLAVLEKSLNQCSDLHRFEVINTAVPGYSTVMEVETLKEKGLLYSPDIVVLHFVQNDARLPNFVREYAPVLSFRRLFLVDFVRTSLHKEEAGTQDLLSQRGFVRSPRDEDRPKRFAEDPDRVPDEYREMVGWSAVAESLTELVSLRERHGFELVVVTDAVKRIPIIRTLMTTCDELSIPVVDVGKEYRKFLAVGGFESLQESPLVVSKRNNHPSAQGHRITADVLLDWLRTEEYLPGSVPDGRSRSVSS